MDTEGIDVREGDMRCLHTGFATMIMEMAGNPDAAKLHSSCAVLNGRDDRLLRWISDTGIVAIRSEEHTSELQSHHDHVCRLLLAKKKKKQKNKQKKTR